MVENSVQRRKQALLKDTNHSAQAELLPGKNAGPLLDSLPPQPLLLLCKKSKAGNLFACVISWFSEHLTLYGLNKNTSAGWIQPIAASLWKRL